jgi:putative heme-binding domain-containing protein
LVDDAGDADAKLAPSHSTGALYLFVAPHDVPPLPVGAWHRAKIRVDGRQVEHWLDGVRVVEADLESDSLRAAMENQRRTDIPKPRHLDELKADRTKAYPIVLTHHGGDAWFRGLRIRVLVSAARAEPGRIPTDAAAAESGKQIYLGSCSGCHGATGEGSQGPSLLSGRASRLPDTTLVNTIRNGLPGTSMPNFPMADERVLQVAAFVRSLTAPAIAMKVPGDSERGRALFFGEGRCSTCHMILGRGGYPGPDLSNIAADRTVPQLTESVMKPSARIADGYRSATAVLKSGQIIQGVAKNYDNYSVQILDRAGKLHLLSRDEIGRLDILDVSMMPAVTEPGQARDVIAFLSRQSTRPANGESR